MKAYLEAGEFVTTHGISGELKLYPWADSAAFVCALPRLFMHKDGGKCVRIESAREHKGMALITLEGVTTVELARAYIGKTAWFARQDANLPEDRYFVQDIIGCKVFDANTNVQYGIVHNVLHPAAHDVYVIKTASGQDVLFPAVKEFLISLNPQEKLITISPIAGMFDENICEVQEQNTAKKEAQN